MTETVMPPEVVAHLRPEAVSALVAWLCHESCAVSGEVFEAGARLLRKGRSHAVDGASLSHQHRRRAGSDSGRLAGYHPARRLYAPRRRDDGAGPGDREHPSGPATAEAPETPTSTEAERTPSTAPAHRKPDGIDVEAALAQSFADQTIAYDERDVVLYALAVGAGGEIPSIRTSSATRTN